MVLLGTSAHAKLRPFTTKDFRILSLNLHAYHPMGEAPRILQNRLGETQEANSDIFFFTPEELDRGSRKRLDVLTKAISELQPDVVLFQEVTAGAPGRTTCQDFYAPSTQDELHENTTLRLKRRLDSIGSNYQAHLSCRGNVGWITNASTFRDHQVLRSTQDGRTEVVIPFGANPYPKGMLIEGLSILTRKPLEVVEHLEWNLPYNETPDRFFVQTLVFSVGPAKTNSPIYVIANIHGGHKVRHFEQAVALRKRIDSHIGQAAWRNRFKAMFIAGDFNAQLYRPKGKTGFIESTPWEVFVDGQFDLRVQNPNFDPTLLAKRLEELNANFRYKPWATIPDLQEARRRIQAAVQAFVQWQKSSVLPSLGISQTLIDAQSRAQSLGLCRPTKVWNITCARENNIDHIFYSPQIKLRNSFIVFSNSDWKSTEGLSDHPGVQAHFDLTSKR